MNSKHVNNILIAIIIISIIIIFLISFGQLDLTDKDEREKKFIEKQKQAKHRHRKLLLLLLQKKELKVKLDKKFKIAYSISRVILVLVYIGLNSICYFFFGVNSFDKLKTLNETIVMVIAGLGFVFYDNFIMISQIVEYFKLKIENWVYGKYLNLPIDIQTLEVSIQHEQEKIKLLPQEV